MYRTASLIKLVTLAILFTIFAAVIARTDLSAAQLTLGWTDNSNNEDGFRLERKTGTAGTYVPIISLGANAGSHVDSNLPAATTFCYRVNAYNSTGSSGYSNEGCATTPSVAPSIYLLTVSKAGTGSGTVTATGINCGSDCSESVASGTQVALTATAAGGSTFATWTGTGCGSTVTVTGKHDLHSDFQLKHIYTDCGQGRDGQRHGHGYRHQLRQRLQRKCCQRDAGCADGDGGRRFDVYRLDGNGL